MDPKVYRRKVKNKVYRRKVKNMSLGRILQGRWKKIYDVGSLSSWKYFLTHNHS